MEEVQDIIHLPDYHADAVNGQKSHGSVEWGVDVALICSMYRKNAFHNFEHESHEL